MHRNIQNHSLSDMNYPISTKRRIFEILLVVLTGISKILVMDTLNLKLPYIILVTLFWLSYFIYRTCTEKELYKYWGLSLSNAKPLFKIVASVGVVLIAVIVIYGVYIEPIHWSVHILFVLLVYPIWGLIQQFLIMSLFAGNIHDFRGKNTGGMITVLLTSILFSIVHYPSFPLMFATLVMAIIYSYLFLKYRNIIPLGLFHGIIGGLFYYVILNRDAWEEFVTKYIN